jgi:uncharacterized protein YjaZ
MQAHFVRADAIYHEIINAPDIETKRQIYRDKLVQPWKPMMDMVSGMWGAQDSDDFAGARLWGWVLPEQLTSVPDVLQKLEAVDAWQTATAALNTGVEAFAPFAERIPLDSVEGWLVIADPQRTDTSGYGYTGAIDFMQPRFICQYDTPNERNLRALPGCVVHEFNHVVRGRVFPWNIQQVTVAEYIVHEGLAESFATELFGADVLGFYVTELDAAGYATAKSLIKDGLDKTGFDVIRAYIFGDYWSDKLNLPKIGMPDYGGYAIGYHVVQAYLKRTGCTVAAATFVPAATIVQESGFFE